MLRDRLPRLERGVTIIEVLVTVVVLALGLFGVAKLQLSAVRVSHEALQRTRAAFLLDDILERMKANAVTNLTAYQRNKVGGGKFSGYANCSNSLTCSANDRVLHDLREWELAIDGADETRGATLVGGLLNPQGNITVNPSGEIRVAISWDKKDTDASGKPLATQLAVEAFLQ